MPDFTFQTPDGPQQITVSELVVAGWTGRNTEAVQHHIEELAALGVPAPSQVPLYYRVGAELLTQAPAISVLGADTSGEAEPLLICDATGTLWLGLASDHTDRALETLSVAKSKQVCPKPVARDLWRFDTVLPEVVLLFRPDCSPVKVDQGFFSGCHSHGFGLVGMDLIRGQDAMGRVGPLGIVIGQPFSNVASSL
jgi:hypothetical protein